MPQADMVNRSVLSPLAALVSRHPRLVFTVVLLLFVLAMQGTVSAETTGVSELGDPLVEPNAGHGSSTGP